MNEPTQSKLRWYAEAVNTPEEPVAWVIDQLVAEGERVVLYGQWRAFKTFLALAWAVQLSAEQKIGTYAVPKARRVLYVNEEMSDRAIWRRIRRLGKGLDIKTDQPLPLAVVTRIGLKLKPRHTSIARLLAHIKEAGLTPGDVVVIDSVRRVLVGSEKDDEAVREFWDAVDQHLVPLGLTVFFLHHMRKPRTKKNVATTHEASGSGDLMAGADGTIAVVRDEGDSVTISQEKNRETEEAAPFAATFDFSEDEFGPIGVEYAMGAINETKDPAHQETLYSHLKGHPGDTQAAIREATGIPKSTLSRLIKRSLKNGSIRGTSKKGFRLAKGAVDAQ